MGETNIISLLEKGDKAILKKLYIEHKDAFINYAQKFPLSKNDVNDIYQDAIIVLFENAKEGKMNALKCSIKTYLFSIGKNMIYEQLRKQKKTVLLNSDFLTDQYDESIEIDEEPLNENQIKLNRGFKQLGEQCKKILTLYYYRGYNLDEITEILNYSKKDVLKSQKYRCLTKLKSIIKD